MDSNPQSSDQQNEAKRGTKRKNSAIDDDFALISLDIVADVLGPHVTFKEVASLSLFNSSWGDLVRSCMFEVNDLHFHGAMKMNFTLGGFQREESLLHETLLKNDPDWSSLNVAFHNIKIVLTHMDFDPSVALKILRSSTGDVSLVDATEFVAKQNLSYKVLYDALVESRASSVVVERYYDDEPTVSADLQSLLANPHLQSLQVNGDEKSLSEIVKLCLNIKTDKEVTFVQSTVENLTEFFEDEGFSNFLDDCGCNRELKINHSIWRKIHPKDNRMVVEVLMQKVDSIEELDFQSFTEVRLYSHGLDYQDGEDEYYPQDIDMQEQLEKLCFNVPE